MSKGFLKTLLPLFITLGVTVFVVHSPDEVTSNISKWAQDFGIPNVPKWLSNPHADHLLALCGIIFAIIYAILVWLIIPYIKKRKPIAFEIIFDRTNPGRQFWALKTIETAPGIEYRVKVRNKTQKTLYEVKATIEAIGPMGAMPTRLIFDQTGETTFALDPGASAFVRLFFAPLPVIQPGTLMGASTAAYGPIRVIVSALDTAAVERTFQFNPLTMGFNPVEESMI
jgi:hypothetical protein